VKKNTRKRNERRRKERKTDPSCIGGESNPVLLRSTSLLNATWRPAHGPKGSA
jgi:hypothetical protein